jgi:hypothetical protein
MTTYRTYRNKHNRLHASVRGGHDLHIKGKVVNIHLAKIVYKCEQCWADLIPHGMGLVCANDSAHRGFIHRKEIQEIQRIQEKEVEDLLADHFEIVDGKVVIKEA